MRENTAKWIMKSVKEKKVIICKNNLVAWDKLTEKMNMLNLSEAEQELIKQDILHKEAEINRRL